MQWSRPVDSQENLRAGRQPPGPHVDIDLFPELLHGLLSKEETEAILAHLSVCATCENLLREGAADLERLRASRSLRCTPDGDVVLEECRTPRREEPAAGEMPRGADLRRPAWRDLLRGLRWPRLAWALSLAGAVALCVVFLWPRHPGTPESVPLYWIAPMGEGTLQRSTEQGALSPALAEALAAYDAHNLPRAIELLSQARAGDENGETFRKIYLGSALAMSGRYEEAVSVLGALPLESAPNPWGMEAHWTLYASLKASGREASADSLLRRLAQGERSIGERARRALGK